MRTWALLCAFLSGCTLFLGLYQGRCGDGFIQEKEQCDDGNNNNNDGCNKKCQSEGPICGDGNIDPGEQCDDGNKEDGDDCSNCKITCTDNLECAESPDNPCTENEQCDTINGVCTSQPAPVDDSDECTIDSCDPNNGIQHVAVDIEDNNQCTADSCNSQTGIIHSPFQTGTSCDLDSNPNTRDICVDANCVPSDCGDNFIDTGAGESCEPPNQGGCDAQCHLGCTSNQECITADNNNPCTTNERCNMGIARCESDLTPTNDNNACTTDSCTAAGVAHDPVPTSDNNLCTLDSCDPSNGNISHTPAAEDNNPCTTDSCNSLNGATSNIPVPDGTLCDADSNAATRDICHNLGCLLSVCGDDVLDGANTGGGTEECDDGNSNDNDGCDSTCTQEITAESESEINDNSITADLFTPGNHLISGVISTALDADFSELSIPANASTMTVRTYGSQGIGSCNIDTNLEVFDDTGNLLATATDNSLNNKCSSISLNVPPFSQRVIKVTGNNVGGGAGYLLLISFQ